MFQRARPAWNGFQLVGLVWVIVGPIVLLMTIPRLWTGMSSRHWPSVTGQVTQSEIVPVKNMAGRVAFYKIDIWYNYSPPMCDTSGCSYRSDRISTQGFIDSTDDSYSLSQAHNLLRQYPDGRIVTVFYNPRNLQQAVLRPGVSAGTVGAVLIGFALLLLGSLLIKAAGRALNSK